MSKRADITVTAHDASVDAEQDLPPDRPATRDELEYLDARVHETAAAVDKIREMIAGLKESLKTAEMLAADAVKARDAGHDLTEVQRRRAA